MEYEDEENKGGLLQRIQESPRTVSALIIILIVAAAIYAFSGDEIDPTQQLANNDNNAEDVVSGDGENQDGENEGENNEDENNGEGEGENNQDGENSEGEGNGDGETNEPTPTPTPTPAENGVGGGEDAEQLPEETKTDEGFVEVAQSGEGITHLARQATSRWLSENNPEYTVSEEHRIYIEDYIQNRLGSERLNLGETKTISFDLIQEAVAAAGQLNDQQLQNLSQYTHAL